MPIDKLKLDAIAKEIADCHMCRPHEMHVREILEKHFGEPKPKPLPCPLCGNPSNRNKDGDICCTDMECPLDGTFTAAEWAKLAGNRLTFPLAGNRLTLPLPVNGTACPVTNVSGTAIRAVVFGMADAAEFANMCAGRRVLSPIDIAVTVAGEEK